MRYCVTGATGLVGNNLVRQLVNNGQDVRVAVRASSNRKSLEKLPVEIIQADLLDAESVSNLLQDIDCLIHAAGIIWFGRKKYQLSYQVNLLTTRVLAECCLQNSIRMVHISSVDALAAGTRDEPANETHVDPAKSDCNYVVTKRLAEQEVLQKFEEGLDGVIVNPGFMIGPYDWKPSSGEMMLAVADGWVPLAPGGGFCVVDVRDVARGIETAASKGRAGQRYILGGENMTYHDLWCRMAAVNNRRGPIKGMSNRLANVVGFLGDAWTSVSGRETNVNSTGLRMGQLFHYYDSAKAQSELGYVITPIELAINDAWMWFVENGYTKTRPKR